MKKYLFLFILLKNLSVVFAFDTNSCFGIQQQQTAEGYQQYVGKSFFVRPAYGSLERWENSGFEYNKEFEGKTFTISNIIVKDVTIKDESTKEITVIAIEDGGKKKINFKGYELKSSTILLDRKKLPLITFMPMVFIEPFNEYKQKHLGEIIKYDNLKDEFEVIDVFIGQDSKDDNSIAELCINVKNRRTGNVISCPYSKIQMTLLKTAENSEEYSQIFKFPINSNNEYEFSEVILSELSKESLFSNAKSWVVENYSDYKAVVQYESEPEGKIVIKGYYEGFLPKIVKDKWFKYECVNYKITIDCKEKKYRYRINDIVLKSVKNYTYSGKDYYSNITHEEHLNNLQLLYNKRERVEKDIEDINSITKGNKNKKTIDELQSQKCDINEEIEFEKDIFEAEYTFFYSLGQSIKKKMDVNDDF